MHAYTGSDTVSAFAGKEKASALKILICNKESHGTFRVLGQEWDLSPDLMDKLEAFTCLLYAPKASAVNVNDLTYQLFCAKKGEIESRQLPPCRECLVKSAQRANYQAAKWRCLEQDPRTPSLVGRGWKLGREEGIEQLIVHWMEGQPAPEALVNLLACSCPRMCELPKCACLSNGLGCTDMCRLQGCANQVSSADNDESVAEDELDDDCDY